MPRAATNRPAAARPAPARTRLIRLIHVARRDIDMADDTYRALLARLCGGKTSSADCSVPELERIIDHLKKAGFKVRKPKAAKPAESRPLATDPESRKLRALWILLHQVGATDSASESSLAVYIRGRAGVDALQFVKPSDRHALIEGLKSWAARVLPAAIDERIARLSAAGAVAHGLTRAHVHAVVAPTLNERRFDALNAVWSWLDGREKGAAAAVQISPTAQPDQAARAPH